jgi:hypothetical protein
MNTRSDITSDVQMTEGVRARVLRLLERELDTSPDATELVSKSEQDGTLRLRLLISRRVEVTISLDETNDDITIRES